jgi:hypothetical protein
MDEATANRLFEELKTDDGALVIDVGSIRSPVPLDARGVQSRDHHGALDYGIELKEPGGRSFVIWETRPFQGAKEGGYQMLPSLGWRDVMRGLLWAVALPEILIIPLVVVGLFLAFTIGGLYATAGYLRDGQWGSAVLAGLVVIGVCGLFLWFLLVTWTSAKRRQLVWRPRNVR